MSQIDASFEAETGEILSRYPVSQRSASMPLLHLWQERFGYISDEGIRWIAEKLELEPIHILELVTFYPAFREKMQGIYRIRICRTLSCRLKGSHELYRNICKRLGLPDDRPSEILTTEDGKFSVEFVECLASCGTAPVMMVNDELHENVEGERVNEILKGLEG